jgi:hypothetical protein
MRIYVHAHYWSETYLNSHESTASLTPRLSVVWRARGRNLIAANTQSARRVNDEYGALITLIGAVLCLCTAFLPKLYVPVGRND